MATKPPSAVNAAPPDSLEKVAYALVEEIPTQEMNDRNRLGYCLWIWLREGKGSLRQAIVNAGTRSEMTTDEITSIITKRMTEKGISPPTPRA